MRGFPEPFAVIVEFTVDEKGGRAVDADTSAAGDRLLDLLAKGWRPQLMLEGFGFEGQLLSVIEDIGQIEQILVFEEKVVHLPKLVARCFGGQRRLQSVGVNVGQREGAENQAEILAEDGLRFFDDRISGARVGAFKIAIMHQNYGCVAVASDVIGIGYGRKLRHNIFTCELAAICRAAYLSIEMDFYQQLRDYQPTDATEVEMKAATLQLIEAHGTDAFRREVAGETGHLTSGAWILNRDATKVLLVYGAKVRRWKLPGEHVDSEDELWAVAQEQAGRALGGAVAAGKEEIFALSSSEIPEYWNTPAHRHFEVVWCFKAEERAELPRGAKWFPLVEAATLENGVFKRLVEKSK